MSYSLERKCHNCKFHDECTDRSFLNAAIQGIHQVGEMSNQEQGKYLRRGHLGAGIITLDCQNFENISQDETNSAG